MADFDFKGQAPVNQIFDAVINKPIREQEMRIKDEANRRERINSIMNAVVTGQTIAKNMLELAGAREQRQGLHDLSAVLKEEPFQPQTSMAPTPGPVTVQPEVTQTASASREIRLRDALLRSNPGAFTKELAQSKFPNSQVSTKEQVHYLTLNDGSNIVARFDTGGRGFMDMSGNPIPQEVLNRVVNRTYAGDFFNDNSTGQNMFGNKSTGQATPVNKSDVGTGDPNDPDNALINLRTKAPKVYEKVSSILENASPVNNQKLGTLVEAAASSSAAKAILLDPNPSEVGLASLGFHMARASGSNSQLSDAERETFEEPLALIEKIKNKGYKIIKGDLSQKMRVDLIRLNTLLERKASKQAEKLLASEKRRARVEAGNYWNSGLDSAFPSLQSLITEAKDIVPEEIPDAPADDIDLAIQQAKKELEDLKKQINGKK